MCWPQRQGSREKGGGCCKNEINQQMQSSFWHSKDWTCFNPLVSHYENAVLSCLVIISCGKVLASGPVHQHTYKYFPSLQFSCWSFLYFVLTPISYGNFLLCFLMSLHLDQWLQRRWVCLTGDIWQCLQTFLVVTIGRMLPTLGGHEPEMALNIQECTGQASTAENYPAPNVSSIRNGNHWSRPSLRAWLDLIYLCTPWF